MASPEELGRLNTLNWKNLQEAADRYHQARKQGAATDLEPFLPPPGDPQRRVVLHELIGTDLELRWEQRQGVRLEYYLEKYPELGSAPELPAKLIHEEYRVRHRCGDRPTLESYQTRFPDQFRELRRLVETTSGVPTPSGSGRPTILIPEGKSGEGILPGGYKALERIGSGAFGEVWRAEAPGGFPAAVKIVFGTLEQEEGKRELESLEVIRKLRHRCLVTTTAFFAEQDRLHIVMELADGSLRSRLEACRQAGLQGIPAEELLVYFRDAAEGLDYLHGKHVLHRDIKPENILLLEGHAKVADFGLARTVQSSRRVQSATGVGTPLYMAPEVFKAHVGTASDQYSLALSYAELRLGRRLLKGTNLMAIMFEVLEETPDLAPLPEAEQRVLLKALSKDPDQRYPKCIDWVRAMEQAVTAAPLPPASETRSVPESRTAPERRSVAETRPEPKPEPEPAPPPPPKPRVKPTGRKTNAPTALRKTSRVEVGRATGRAPPAPSWRAPQRQQQQQQQHYPTWFLLLLLAILAAVIAALVYRLVVVRPPAEPVPLRVEAPNSLQVVAGKAARLPLQVHRGSFREPIHFTVNGLPPHVRIPDETLAAEEEQLEFTVVADPEAQPTTTSGVTITADADGKHHEVPLSLNVLVLPADCQASDTLVDRDVHNHPYYRHVARVLKDGPPVELVVVPQARESDPPTFYIMVDKVSVGLFTRYLHDTKAEAPPQWNPKAAGNLPALFVRVSDAYHFAEWLGGELPTAKQWDKAAGRYDPGGRQGPFRKEWNDKDRPDVAVRIEQPRPVGEAKDDVSVYGCRDMAGNGSEWTASPPSDPNRRFKVGDFKRVVDLALRGWPFTAKKPPLFEDLGGQDAQGSDATTPDLGFRVVLELK
jgi:serine/threonine protein kinase